MNQNEKYITSQEVRKTFKVSNSSLKRWNNEGKLRAIRTNGGHRMYPESEINKFFNIKEKTKVRRFICYARVSSSKQKGDLERQAKELQEEYPTYEIIKDVGSGINWKRKGFTKMVDSILKGDIEEIVVTHKDRLCRIGFELVEQMCKAFDTKIVVLNNVSKEQDKDLAEDLLSIVTIFTARHHGRRAAQKRKRRTQKEKAKDEERKGKVRKINTNALQKNKNVPNNKTKRNTKKMDGDL